MTERCDLLSRRRFLIGAGAVSATVVAGGYALQVFARDPAAPVPELVVPTSIAAGAPTNRTLVVVELGGGNDGLSMVVPHATDAYHDLRRATAVAEPLDLDGSVGVHPNLTTVADLYGAGQVAVVEGVGYPDSDLSHFVSMATWWTASPGLDLHTGWLGRYLDHAVGYDHPLAGITIGPGPSQAMSGAASFAVAIEDVSGLQPRVPDWMDDPDELMSAWAGMVPTTPAPGLLGEVHRTIAQTTAAREQVNARLGVGDRDRLRGRQMAAQLDLAAQLIVSGVAPQVLYVHGVGDFDTHENQPNRHAALMEDLNAGLATFFERVNAAGKADDVMVLTASEFGRRARDNGSGTDHGTASTHLLIGPSVSGGRYGEAPSLLATDPAGNVTPTVDFRSVYATVLDEWLEADADEILGANFERLGAISRAGGRPSHLPPLRA